MTESHDASLVDIHSHLVPGVDDGARDVAAVLTAVERMTHAGIRRIVTTPHIRGSLTLDVSRYESRLGQVTQAFEEARAAIRTEFPEVDFRRGHEVLIDVPHVDFSDPRIRLAGTSFVLIEWPRLQIPPHTPRVIEGIRRQGYRPIVAHPERYVGLEAEFGLAGRWREMGAYLQVNFGSLVGRYGSDAQSAAYGLLERGWVDYLASDYHGHPTMRVYKSEAWAELSRRDAEQTVDLLARTNPALMLDDREPLPVPLLPAEPLLLSRLRGMLRRDDA